MEELAAAERERAELAAALQQLAAERDGLQQRLAAAEADGAALRRMVRLLKSGGDSAAPSPSAPAAVGMAGSAARPRSRARSAHQAGDGDDAELQQQQLDDGSNSGSSDEAQERRQQGAGGSAKRNGGSDSTARQARFLEEQVQSLTAALRRLQLQNRELAAQLAAAGGAAAAQGTLALQPVGTAAAAAAELHAEVSGLAAENAALRRQLAEAEEEAGRAQQCMHQQQTEARALHSQVVEVSQERSGQHFFLKMVSIRTGAASRAFASQIDG